MTTVLHGAEFDVLSDDSEFVQGLRRGLETSIVSSADTYRPVAVDRTTTPTVEIVLPHAHPEDRAAIQQLIDRITREVEAWNLEHRLLIPAGVVKHLHAVGRLSERIDGAFNALGMFGLLSPLLLAAAMILTAAH